MRSLLTFIVPLNSLFLLTISIQSAFFIFKSNDRPPMFVPKNQLKSIACGRGNGTRFVDMQIQLEEDHSIPSVKFDLMELTNIPRDELAVLDTYIHKTLIPSMLNDISNDGKQKDDQTEEEEDSINDDDNTDEDQEENDDNKKQNTKKRPRSRRACAQEARRITKSQINKVPIVDDEESDSADDEDVVFQNDSDTSNSDSDDEDSISLESDTESDHDDDDVGDDDMQTAKKSKTI